MARKHSKAHTVSAPVERTLVRSELRERKVVTNPVTKEFETKHVTTPAVWEQGRAQASTRVRGNKNVPTNMSPKGKSVSKPVKGGAR